MTPARWARIKEIFCGALEQPEGRRTAWIESECGADGPLRDEVEGLIAQDDGSLESPAPLVPAKPVPTLSSGEMLSHYRIESRLGQGGMGIVYRAWDTQLRRWVALKVLCQEYLKSADSKLRLVKEARAASALNHPSIVSIYEVASDNGVDFIAMEYIEGKTLNEIIPAKGFKVAAALEYAVQIAAGLAKAHSAGVIHRDLKPRNIMVRDDGLVKLLDFGLARRVRPPDAEASTLTIDGEIAGTPAYMSPEQVEGRPIDARSDVFSFGAILYEILTGRRAFPGDSTASVLSLVMRTDPMPLSKPVPGMLEKIVARCLRKDPSRRFQYMDDVKVELEELKGETEFRISGAEAAPEKVRFWRLWRPVGALLLLAFGVGTGLLIEIPIDTSSHRYSPVMNLMHRRRIEEGGGFGAHLPMWSPDAKSIAYSADGLRLQRLDSLDSQRLTTEGLDPFFSPDGSRLYYLSASGKSSRELWSVSAVGGVPEVVLTDLGGFGPMLDGAALSRDGDALAVVRSLRSGEDEMAVWISSPPGSPPHPYPGSPVGRNLNRAHLRFSPDRSKLLLILAPYGQQVEWWLLRWPPPAAARSDAVRQLFKNGPRGWFISSADWLSNSRHLVIAANEEGEMGGPLWIADTLTGRWRRITPDSFLCTSPRVADDGRVLFHVPSRDEHAIEIPLDDSPIRPLLPGLRREQYPSWSPVADQILFVTNQRGEPEIWLASRKEGWQRPVVTQQHFPPELGPRQFICPVFSPDGARVAYSSKGAVWVSPIAGGPPVRICDGYCPTWSPDGQWLAFVNNPRATTPTLLKVRVGPSRAPVPICSSLGRWLPQWSPDGKWITIQRPEGFGVISPNGTRTRILYKGTLDWGSACGWSRDASKLYVAYLTEKGRVLSAFDIVTGTEHQVRDLGVLNFSYFLFYSAGLSPSPDGKALVASTLSMRLEPWILDGLQPPRSLWNWLFTR